MPANFEIVIVLAYLSRAVALYHQHISILPKSIEHSMHDHLMTTLISAVEISIIEGSVRCQYSTSCFNCMALCIFNIAVSPFGNMIDAQKKYFATNSAPATALYLLQRKSNYRSLGSTLKCIIHFVYQSYTFPCSLTLQL